MVITDVAFKLDALETFVYSFKYEDFEVDEYIHGIVIEYISTNFDGSPEIVKIKQINNLVDYLAGKEDYSFTERIFRVSELNPFINWRQVL